MHFRLAGLKSSAVNLFSSSPTTSLGSDSPRSAIDFSSITERISSYRTAAAAAKAQSVEGATPSGVGVSVQLDDTAVASWVGPRTASLSSLSRPSADAPLQQPDGWLQAQVVNAELLQLEGRDCIVYKIHVADPRGEWTVTRRCGDLL